MGHSLVGQCKITTPLATSNLSLEVDLNIKNHKKLLKGLDFELCLIVPFLDATALSCNAKLSGWLAGSLTLFRRLVTDRRLKRESR